MPRRATKPTHGGHREGAGRKPGTALPVRTAIYIEHRHKRMLDALVKRWEVSGPSAVIRRILDTYEF